MGTAPLEADMDALDYTDDIALADTRVAVCGDWHGDVAWVRTLMRAWPHLAPGVTTLFHLGDWWMPPRSTDAAFKEAGVARVYVTLGNHEPWRDITRLQNARPGMAVQVSEVTWLLPRPARMLIGGRTALSLGGAVSVDKGWRREGVDWWPDEAITDEHVAAAIAGGPADIMFAHESPAWTPVRAVREVLRTNPMGFPDDARAESAASRARVGTVWDAVQPALLMHGHMHVPGGGATDDGRRVASLGQNNQQGNLALLDLASLTLETPSLRQIREAAGIS